MKRWRKNVKRETSKKNQRTHNARYTSRFTSDGFTLIEMIGVLAVIAILVALLLPKVFDVMAESKVRALVAAVRTHKTAIVDYCADIRSILPLDVDGVPSVETTGDSANPLSLPARLTLDKSDPLNTGTNRWVKFRGPYLPNFSSDVPPGLGTRVFMPVRDVPAFGTATTATNRGYDFDNDGNSDIPTNAHVVFLRFRSVALQDYERVDSILDPGIGSTEAERQVRGQVKYDAATNRMRVYLLHK
ncbi:type II secretion system protein [Candidatus Nitrospira salsa]